MKLFGREPELWTAAIVAVASALATFSIPGMSAGQVFAIGGVLVAVINAVTTRPIGPGVFTGLLTAVVAVLAEYGTRLTEGQVTTLSAVVLAIFTLVARPQATPGTGASRVRPTTTEKVAAQREAKYGSLK